MGTILITGASGFIGSALAKHLNTHHAVIVMSRKDPKLDLPWIRGEFFSFEDLRGADKYDIESVVHLAAVTGGCSERDGMMVNVEGTRCFMRYCIDRGIKKFVMASSIAVVGAQSTTFRPVALPMADDHPCLDRDGYGFSKYLMEEVTRYHARQNPDIDVINLRLAAIVPDDKPPAPGGLRDLHPWALCSLALMTRADALDAFTRAVDAPHKPGVRTLNAAGPRAWSAVPTAEILRHWFGTEVDASFYDKPENRFAGVFDVRKIRDELGFVARHLPPKAS